MIIAPLTPITVITKDEFHKIDERMLGHAFAIHNQYGRLFDEVIYSRNWLSVAREMAWTFNVRFEFG